MMQTRPLETLFEAMFHGKRSFADFARGPIDANYVRHPFSKKGKGREVVSPNEQLRHYHDFLRVFLFDFLPINEHVVYSYRKRVSAYDAVILHARSNHFFLCDIQDFFPSLNRSLVKQTIMSGRTRCPIADLDLWLERILDLVCVDDAIPVGFSTSPAISNAALLPFDNAFSDFCRANGLVYTRYSDDILVSSDDLTAMKGTEDVLSRLLIEVFRGDLKLNPNKSKLLHKGAKIRLLGMVLLPNGTVSVDSTVKAEIEVLIHFYITDRAKFANRVDGGEQKAEARLAGLLNYVNTVDKRYLDKLRRKFGAAVVDLFLHRSFA